MKNLTCAINISEDEIFYLVHLVRPFWDNPNETMFNRIMHVYHVKYIFLDSESSYFTLYSNWQPKVGPSAPYEYLNKPHSADYYKSFFQSMPNVKLVISKGAATIYQVN